MHTAVEAPEAQGHTQGHTAGRQWTGLPGHRHLWGSRALSKRAQSILKPTHVTQHFPEMRKNRIPAWAAAAGPLQRPQRGSVAAAYFSSEELCNPKDHRVEGSGAATTGKAAQCRAGALESPPQGAVTPESPSSSPGVSRAGRGSPHPGPGGSLSAGFGCKSGQQYFS